MSLIQAVGADNSGGATTLTINVVSTAAGSLLSVGFSSSGNSTATVSDNVNGAWTVHRTGGKVHEASKTNASAGVTVVTITYNTSQDGQAIFTEDSGMNNTSALDQVTAQASQTGVTTWTTPASATLAQANEIGYASAFTPNSSFYFSNSGLGSGWAIMSGTGISAAGTHDANGDSFIRIRKVYSATTADTGSGACNVGANPFSGLALYKSSGGGGGGSGQDALLLLL